MHPTRYVAARTGGTRYHLPGCPGLQHTRAVGNEVPITRPGILAQRLLPCAACTAAGMPLVPALAAV